MTGFFPCFAPPFLKFDKDAAEICDATGSTYRIHSFDDLVSGQENFENRNFTPQRGFVRTDEHGIVISISGCDKTCPDLQYFDKLDFQKTGARFWNGFWIIQRHHSCADGISGTQIVQIKSDKALHHVKSVAVQMTKLEKGMTETVMDFSCKLSRC